MNALVLAVSVVLWAGYVVQHSAADQLWAVGVVSFALLIVVLDRVFEARR